MDEERLTLKEEIGPPVSHFPAEVLAHPSPMPGVHRPPGYVPPGLHDRWVRVTWYPRRGIRCPPMHWVQSPLWTWENVRGVGLPTNSTIRQGDWFRTITGR